jgi:hypothetical protein
MANAITEARIPFQSMSFTPDVPSTALGPNEYNAGFNVETDVRGIRSINGDEAILQTVPGTPTYVSGGFRADGKFWFIVATVEGYWWASKGDAWINITPGGGPISGYAQNTNITEAWNGTVPFFNDSINPPIFWPENTNIMIAYIDIIQRHKTLIDYSYDQISANVRTSKIKEKMMVIERLKKMSIEERRVENMMKTYRLGKWNVGQQKGLFIYDEATQERERHELLEQGVKDNEEIYKLAVASLDTTDNQTEINAVTIHDIIREDQENEEIEIFNESYDISNLGQDYDEGYGEDTEQGDFEDT